MKPKSPFRAVLTGSPYPVTVEEFEAGDEAARIALDLGLLTAANAKKVRSAHGLDIAADTGADDDDDDERDDDEGGATAGAGDAKSDGSAPENKAD